MSDETPISTSREQQLLGIMADQQRELDTFRSNTHERLANLERRPRRSMQSLLALDFDSMISMALLAVGIVIVARMIFYFAAQAKLKGETHANSQMS